MKTDSTNGKPRFFVSYPLWLKIVLILILVYILGGIGFGIATYKKCPAEWDKKCARENKAVKFAANIYPFPAAWVNSTPIWVKNFDKQLDYVQHFASKSQQELPDRQTLTDQLLGQMMDTIIIKDQAKKDGIKVTNKDMEDAYAKVVDQNGGKDEVKKVLQDLYGMSESEFKSLIKDQIYKEKIQSDLIAQVHVEHILIKDENKAKEVLEQAKKGDKSFEDLAKEFSEDTGSKDSGGDLGWVTRGTMVKEFEDAAFSTEVGKIKDSLTQTQFGYHIIKVLEKKGTIDKSYTDWFTDVKSQYKTKIWLLFN